MKFILKIKKIRYVRGSEKRTKGWSCTENMKGEKKLFS